MIPGVTSQQTRGRGLQLSAQLEFVMFGCYVTEARINTDCLSECGHPVDDTPSYVTNSLGAICDLSQFTCHVAPL